MKINKIGCRTLRVPVELVVGQKIPIGKTRMTKVGVRHAGVKIDVINDDGSIILENGICGIYENGCLTIRG